jgi:hypothetical protein
MRRDFPPAMSNPSLNPQFRRRWREPPSAAQYGGRATGPASSFHEQPGRRARKRRPMPPHEVRERSFTRALKGNPRGFAVVVVELACRRALTMHWP